MNQKSLRESLWKCKDDVDDLLIALTQAKVEVTFNRDARYMLRTAEVKLNKVIEEFNQIVKILDDPDNQRSVTE